MARLVVRYRNEEQVHWAELIGTVPSAKDHELTVAPIEVSASTVGELIVAMPAAGAPRGEHRVIPASWLLSPITSDTTIFCQGLNYQEHAAESNHTKRKNNLIFAKASSSLSGPFDDIVRPQEVQLLDYEVELGLVMRRDLGADDVITEDNLGSAIAGVILCNDVSARDTMFGESFLQWFRGKSYRTFCPVGPVLTLLDPDEVESFLSTLEIRLWLNGDLRQHGRYDQLIFPPAETLSHIASTMDLRRGDLLMTGTPGGVIAHATPQVVQILKENLFSDDVRREQLRAELTSHQTFLRPGDVVKATLTRGDTTFGALENGIVDQA
jgi:2-keto-4-pentenoate hydratase/2-oxohepta-3-ene-1,7-dioic acid hydratase in catechol pathway